jgi:hypothetical protein
MRRLVLSSCAALLLIAATTSANAFETNGKFGVGYDADLNGATVRYFFADRMGIDVTLGFSLQTARADGQETDFDMILAPKLVYAFRLHDKVNLNLEGGAFLQVLGTNSNVSTDLNLGFFGGVAPELLIWDHLSVEVFFGLSLALNNLLEEQGKLNVALGTLGQQLSVVSGAAFRYYF